MNYLFLFLTLTTTSVLAQAANMPTHYQQLVEDAVIQNYSQGWEDETFSMSKDDIWGLELTQNNSSQCIATVTGYAKKPSYNGSSTHRFWVCIANDSSGNLKAELIDSEQWADE